MPRSRVKFPHLTIRPLLPVFDRHPPLVLRPTMPLVNTNAHIFRISPSYRDYCALVERNDQEALAGLPPLRPHPDTGVPLPSSAVMSSVLTCLPSSSLPFSASSSVGMASMSRSNLRLGREVKKALLSIDRPVCHRGPAVNVP